MDNLFVFLDSALRSRYLLLEALPNSAIWGHIPEELRSEFSAAFANGEPIRVIISLLWQVRARLLGKPESSSERTRLHAILQIGLLYITHREGRLDTADMLSKAFHVADSYVCDLSFLMLRNDLRKGNLDAEAMKVLFAPHVELAEQLLNRWGLM